VKIKHIPLLTIVTLLTLFFISCVQLPDDSIAPSWDATFAFPIGDSSFVLGEIIDDSTIVVSDDPASLGVLVFQEKSDIDPFFVDSSLVIDGFSLSASQVVGAISINDTDPISTKILVTDWAPSVVPGDSMIFPESESELEIPFPRIDAFSYAVLDNGTLKIVISNNLPVELELRGITIKNVVSNTVVAQYSQTLILPMESKDSLSFNLAGVTIEDSLYYEGTIYSAGSGTEVEIPVEAGTEIMGSFENLVISEVKAVLPEQDPFSTEDFFVFDDSTYLETAEFYDGSFQIVLNNNLDLDINLDLEIKNLKKANGTSYTEHISLSRKELNKVISYPDISNWKIVTLTPGTPTNKIEYSATVTTVASNDPRTISKTDSVSIDIDFSDVILNYAEGKIAPVCFNIEESEFSFDLGNLDGNLDFDSIHISAPSMVLGFSSSIDFEVLLNGIVTGSTDNITNQMKVELDLPAKGDKEFDLDDFGFTDFINSFTNTGEIPNKFIFSGSGTVNPKYKNGSVAKTDSVKGSFAFEVPFDFGISGGTFKDTIRIDSLDMDDETIDAINSIELTLETLNKIPVNLVLVGTVLDINDQPLFPFPPSYSPDKEILIEAPIVDKNGNVISAEINKQIIKLLGDDAKMFINNPNIAIKFSLDTPPLNSMAPVKFKDTDVLSYKIYGKINYRVNN
jgi:hypothetical protein